MRQPSDFKKLEELLARKQDAASPLPENVHDLGTLLASRWYITSVVKPVIVDLVAEFAGQEQTALDGDSLLMLCYQTAEAMSSEAQQTELQPLVVVYLVEKFLVRLIKAKLNFTIVWFQDRAWINFTSGGASSKRFARQAVRSHLTKHCPEIRQAHFPSISSPEWRRWLELERPYAILATDGGSVQHATEGAEPADIYAIAQHVSGGLAVDTLCEGISVALISNDMFEDSKILCFLIVSTPLARHAIQLQRQGYQRFELQLKAQHDRYAPGENPIDKPSPASTPELSTAETIALLGADDPQANETCRIAIILQALLIEALPLEKRALLSECKEISREAQIFLARAFDQAAQWLESHKESTANAADLIDPRLFAFCFTSLNLVVQSLPQPLKERLLLLCQSIGISSLPHVSAPSSPSPQKTEAHEPIGLLPYKCPIDLTLPELPTRSDAGPASEHDDFLPRLTATAESSLLTKANPLHLYGRPGRETKAPRDAHGRILNRLQAKQFRANQRYASWVTAYAQSLLGSSGLIRQAITEGPVLREDEKKVSKPQHQPKQTTKKLSKKEQIIAQNQKDKSSKASAQVDRKLTYLLEELQIGSAVSKFDSADPIMIKDRRRQINTLAGYIAAASPPPQSRDLLLLRVRLALEAWVAACTISSIEKEQCFDLAVMIFTDLAKILSYTPVEGFNEHERALLCSCGQASRVLGVQGVFGPSHAGLEEVWTEVEEKKGKPKKGEFAFDINWPKASKKYSVGDALEFQLKHCGDVMIRELDSKEDRRVTGFKPDAWQRDVLDAVDARDDTLVVAPTSAGKTFIAFYCIEKALRESSDAVVVYIAPSKALVNQIAAELEARYTKNFGTTERTIWAISAGDFDVHNPLKAQVLVAAPSVLHDMCLNTEVASSWLPRVRSVIMDEIHSLTDLDLGPIWQQLLAFVPCPIIALSATVGNVDEFGEWLKKVRKQQGQKVTIVQHSTRYSDLKKHVYVPLSTAALEPFKGISKYAGKSPFFALHPFTALRPAGSVIPADLEMTPAEQLQLVRAMQATSAQEYVVEDKLDPSNFFADVVGPLTRAHTLAYQEALREAMKSWMAREDSRNIGSPFLSLLDALENGLSKKIDETNEAWPATMSHIDFQRENLLPFLSGLDNQKLLPALLFDFNRDDVETLGRYLVAELARQEEYYKAHNKSWQVKLQEWQQWKDDEPARKKAEERKLKALKGREEADAVKKDARATDVGWQASFDPEAPLPDFTFANEKCGLALEDIVVDVEKVNTLQWMKDGLIRGIGIHHVSLPTSYRQIVERWFRKGWLRVVICTGSLALGINMPARTSVFVGDHTQLDALQYRQAAGRAGRRGMDLTGNVVFYGVPWTKVQRLLTSKLPALDCDLPTSATLYLRLHQLIADSSSRQAGKRMMQAAVRLEKPPNRQDQFPLAHQLRASVEYLRRFGLLSAEGQPLALSGITSQLASSEPANLAFVELLRTGCLYIVASYGQVNRVEAVEEMVVILSHLFASRKSNPTRKFAEGEQPLPDLPQMTRHVLTNLQQQAIDTYLAFAASVAEDGESRDQLSKLPLSMIQVGGTDNTLCLAPAEHQKRLVSQSAFAAIAGSSEKFSAEAGFVQSGLSISHRVVPFLERILDTSPKNAYILDFFRHGHLASLSEDSGLPGETFAWAALHDFWNVLLSVRAILEILLQAVSHSRDRDGTAVGSSDFDTQEDPGPVGLYYDEDGDLDVEDDAHRTDSGIAGSQMSGIAGSKANLISQGPEIRTKSGKRVEPVKPPIDVPNKHPQLYVVYEMIVDIQRNYHGKFFKTFA